MNLYEKNVYAEKQKEPKSIDPLTLKAITPELPENRIDDKRATGT